MNCRPSIIIIILLSLGLNSSAQEQSAERKQTFPLSIAYSSHSWAFPLTQVIRMNPQYPGMAVGTEIYYRKRAKTKLFQTIEAGGFINQSSGSALYFQSDIAYRYTADFGMMLDIGLGFGLFKTYYTRDTYSQDATGAYTKSSDNGVSALSQNIFLSVGYDLSKKTDKNWMPFLRYQWIASAAYWSTIPIRPNGLLQVGVQIPLL